MCRQPAAVSSHEPYEVVCASLSASVEDELPTILAGLRILGCEVSQDPDAEDRIVVSAFLPAAERALAAEVVVRLREAGARALRCGKIQPEDWLAAYREAARPFAVGATWWLDPRPEDPTPAPAGRTRLAVEPRSAFGTGSHESTQLILLELEERALDGARVLDVGTGTGILALAAAARGAGWVAALDVDPDAVWVARQVVAQQDGVEPRSCLFIGPVGAIGAASFDLVLCNMIPEHFRPLLGDLRRLLVDGGEALISGLLADQEEAVAADCEAAGLRVAGRRQLGEWLAVSAIRRTAS